MNQNPRSILADARQIIQTLIDESGKSVRAVAIEAGMQQPALHRYLSGETEELEAKNYVALALHFGVTVSQLIGEVPFEADPKIRAMTRLMEHLPEDKKAALLAAGNAFAQSPNGKAA